LAAVFSLSLLVGSGVPAQAVFNGSPVEPDAYPWLVRFEAVTNFHNVDVCTGSLIAANMVLTAAHCLYNDDGTPRTNDDGTPRTAMNVTFHFGSHPGQYSVSVASADMPKDSYRKFNLGTYQDDIALLTLKSSVGEPKVPLGHVDAPLNSTVRQIGYGCLTDPETTTLPCKSFPGKPQATMTTVMFPTLCPKNVTVSSLCTFAQGTYVNHGDSGGPVLQDVNGVVTLVGVASTYAGFAYGGYFGTFTSANYEWSWIVERALIR
jgi:secreted trypsin-like serine protease